MTYIADADARERLVAVQDPILGDDIVSLNLVNSVDIDHDDEIIHISLLLGAPYSPIESAVAGEVREALGDLFYEVDLTADIESDIDPEEDVLPGVQNVIAVASGKGGVGKSTVAVNLAAGLADMGAEVGLFDADVYGPNVPRMVDADEYPSATPDEKMIPPKQHGMKLMSMDFLLGDDDPAIWRGPMVQKALTALWDDVEWGYLDYMVVDLPPGTGDTQLTMLQTVPVTGAVIVTTPQDVALDDARKGLEMFGEFDTPVLGIVENMSTFHCPDCGGEHPIFDSGGGQALANEAELPFLGEIPIDPSIREGGDDGAPLVLEDAETSEALQEFAEETADMQGVVHRQRQI
jgi:ATP-binding protein involved in chromosome partitioning